MIEMETCFNAVYGIFCKNMHYIVHLL